MVDLVKNPTKSKILKNVLEVIGLSTKPIGNYGIKKITHGTGDVNRIVQELCPSYIGTLYNQEKYLLNFTQMWKSINSGNYKVHLYHRLLKLFSLKQEVINSGIEYNFGNGKNDTIDILNFKGDKWIICSQEVHPKYYFSFFLNASGYGRMTLYDKNDCQIDSRQLRCADTTKGVLVYVEIPGSYQPYFLYVEFTEKAKKEIKEIKKMHGLKQSSSHDLTSIYLDRRNWVFTLNLRGFLLYLLTITPGKDRKYRQLLLNLSSRYDKIFPFLLSWEYFEKVGFPVIKVLQKISREYAQFLSHPAWTDDYLLCEITKRYYKQLSGYFTFKEQKPIVKEIDSKICELSSEKIDSETLLHLNNFRCQNLELIKKSLEQELETVNKDIKFYSTIIDHSNKC